MTTLFFSFLKIGLFTIGGGYAMIPLIKEYIDKYLWATNNEFLEFIAISESTPGPFAINISTFIGFKNSGIIGAVLCTLGVLLPSFVIIIIISKFFIKFKEAKIIRYVLDNLKTIVLSLLIYSVTNISFKLIFNNNTLDIKNILVLLAIYLINLKLKLSPIILILISGISGIIFL